MKYRIGILSISFLIFVCCIQTSCSSDAGDGYVKPKEYVPIELSSGESEIAKCQAGFSFSYFRNVLMENENKNESLSNTVISPFSAYLCLSMLANGVAPEAQEQMLEVLAPKYVNIRQLNDFNKKLLKGLVSIDNSTKLNFANSAWFDKEYTVKKDFKSVIKDYYNASSSSLNFSDNKFINTVNSWVSDATHGLITNAIKEYMSPKFFLLINTLYFKGQWLNEFKKEGTKRASFRNWNGFLSDVMMMRQSGDKYNYFEEDGVKMVEIPYGNKAYSLRVILPDDNRIMERFINDFDEDRWKYLIKNSTDEWVNISLPRFEVRSDFDLLNIIRALGMSKLFNHNAFCNISSDYPDDMTFKSFQSVAISVDESGTKAAVETNVMGGEYANIPSTQEKPYIFTVDHPFLFVIEERSTGAILFMGKVVNL